MSFEPVRAVSDALLYEGYALYPYRPTALKNRTRWSIGALFPSGSAPVAAGRERAGLLCACLLRAGPGARLAVRLRFLHTVTATSDAAPHVWEEAMPREVDMGPLEIGALIESGREMRHAFSFPRSSVAGPDPAPSVPGAAEARRVAERLDGRLDVSAIDAGDGIVLLSAAVTNDTATPGGAPDDQARARALGSAHLLLRAEGAEFISLVDPPAALRPLVERCRSVGVWPVLAGDEAARDLLLAAPIILGDFPQVAPESPGDLFDATEIDEILTLRVLTLGEDERRQSRDGRVRGALARTEGLAGGDLERLHGAVRLKRAPGPPPRTVRAGGADLGAGDAVRLRPRGRADIFDTALAGRRARIVSVEEDQEGRAYVTVTVDDDPGADLGRSGHPGHRFFFSPEEIEPLEGKRP